MLRKQGWITDAGKLQDLGRSIHASGHDDLASLLNCVRLSASQLNTDGNYFVLDEGAAHQSIGG